MLLIFSVPGALLGSGPRSAKSFATTLDREPSVPNLRRIRPRTPSTPKCSLQHLTRGFALKFHKQLRAREQDRGCPWIRKASCTLEVRIVEADKVVHIGNVRYREHEAFSLASLAWNHPNRLHMALRQPGGSGSCRTQRASYSHSSCFSPPTPDAALFPSLDPRTALRPSRMRCRLKLEAYLS